MAVLKRLLLTLAIVALSFPAYAQTNSAGLPIPGCPVGISPTAACGYPDVSSLQLGDLVFTFQYGQNPHERAATWADALGLLSTEPSVAFNSGASAVVIGPGSAAPELMPLSGFSGLFTLPNNDVLANISGVSGPATATTVSSLFSSVFGTATGSLLEYGGTSWQALTPGASGYVLTSNGPTLAPSWQPGGSGSGSVIGPSSSTAGDLSCWNNTSGTLLSDCGAKPVLDTTANQVLYNNSSAQMAGVAFGAANTCLVGQGTTSPPIFEACPGGGGGGTVNTGTTGQYAFYSATGTAVSGGNDVIESSGTLVLETNIKLSSTYLTSQVEVGIGIGLGATPGAWLDVEGPDTSSGTLAFRARNSSGTVIFEGNDAGAVSGLGPVTLGLAGSTGGSIVLNGATSGTDTISVPAAAGTGTAFELPATNGTSGQFLQTNGSGVLAWASPTGSGTVNTGTTGQMPYYAANGTTVSPAPDVSLSAGALSLGVPGTAAGSIVLGGSTSGSVTFGVAAVAGSGTVFTLPSTDGTSGEFLETNGSGVTSWVTPAGGGNVTGPASSSTGDLSCFNNTTGTLLEDCGAPPSAFGGTNEVLAVNGSSAEVGIAYGAGGTVLLGNGTTTAPTFGNLALTNLSGLPSTAEQIIVGTGSATQLETLTAGSGITLTQNTGSQTLTIAATGGGGGSNQVKQSVGWLAGQNPNSAGVIADIQSTLTITAIAFREEVALGATGTIAVYSAPSGTACASGTNLASNTFNANGTAATNQTLTLTTTTVAAGSSVCLVTTGGSNWTSGASIGTVTLYGTD